MATKRKQREPCQQFSVRQLRKDVVGHKPPATREQRGKKESLCKLLGYGPPYTAKPHVSPKGSPRAAKKTSAGKGKGKGRTSGGRTKKPAAAKASPGLTVVDLKELLRGAGVTGYSKKNKQELEELAMQLGLL